MEMEIRKWLRLERYHSKAQDMRDLASCDNGTNHASSKGVRGKKVGASTQKILYPAQKTCESIFSMR
jgi:hypothetical protein